MMRICAFLALGALLCGPNAGAATYVVATDGDDANPGTLDQPLRTIQAAAARMQPGDVCEIRGGVYRETVRPAHSGRPDAPLVFRAYAEERAVVSGADLVSGWEPAEDGQWAAPLAGPAAEQVFVDGRMMPAACWPNTALDPFDRVWAEADKGTNATRIVDAALPELDLAGATLHVLPGRRWVSWARPVDGLDAAAHAIAVNADWDQSSAYKMEEGTRYYAFGTRALLDAPGEWSHDADAGKLYMKTVDGRAAGAHRVEVKRRARAFDLTDRYNIRIQGIRVFAATISLSGAVNCVVEGCHVRYASHFLNPSGWNKYLDTGIVLAGRGNVVRDSSVVYSAGNGVTLIGEDNTLTNCVVRRANYMATDCGAVWMEGRGNEVSRCSLGLTGRSVLLHRYLQAGRIVHNDMHDGGLLTTDLGMTYCYNTDGAGTEIAWNWVHHNRAAHVGVGIYIDNGSKNFLIHHNVCWDNEDSGIRLNTPSHDNRLYHNTLLDNGNSLSYWGPDGEKDQQGCVAVNNIMTDEIRLGTGIEAHHNCAQADPKLAAPLARDFRPQADSPCIDAGVPVAGVTGAVTGNAPDAGAYERGADLWRPGHDWGEPPVF